MKERNQIFPSILLIFLEMLSIVFYGIFTEYHADANILLQNRSTNIYRQYGLFQDIHVMMFIGFGFLMTFLKKFWFSSLGMNFYIAAFALQWSILIDGFFDRLLRNDLDFWNQKIQIDVKSLINADFAAASILICFGAVLGKVTLNQLNLLAFLQLIFYSLNQFIAVVHLQIQDIGGSMIIHTFGAYFGLAASKVLTNKRTLLSSADVQGSNYASDLFSMIGTIFLWMYWPSFNGAMADFDARERVVIHTVLSLTMSCLFSFIISRLVNSDEKFDMIHIQNASLAGGVAIGAVANLSIMASSAMIIGAFAGTISVLGFKFLQPFLEKAIGLYDTCGVNNLHGMPGIIGGIASAIAAGAAGYDTYGEEVLYELFPEVAKGRSCVHQGAYQILCLSITLVLALISGTFSGYIVKWTCAPPEKYFQDVLHWEGAEGYIPVKKDPVTTEDKYRMEQKVIELEAVTRHHKPTMMFQPQQFAELQKFDKNAKSNPQEKHKQNLKNIDFVEEMLNNMPGTGSEEKILGRKIGNENIRFEKTEVRSPDKEQRAQSPSQYTKVKNERE